ncbi:enoyl-CoA hydratase/isomerase family protein [Streptomyces sp. NPDC047028]|uniref:enoyl-CoA hydratase/isomerase family protein n=1 Tax=Streptomyces sp. NPDC047028 TaxID=3155793 RepID=UPI0033FF98B0
MTSWTSERRGRLAILTFSRPPQNLMDLASMAELAGLLRSLSEQTDQVSAVMLTSDADGIFIKHADLDDLARGARGELTDEERGAWGTALRLLEEIPQPTIAAIDGQAWGGGLETALACTLRIASRRSHFCQPEILNGLIPGGGGTQRLPRIVGMTRAAHMILSGRIIQAEEAYEAGLLNAVLETGGFALSAPQWAAQIVAQSPTALFAAKRALMQGRGLDLEQGLALERQQFQQTLATSSVSRRP